MTASRQAGDANTVTASVRQFCATLRARFEGCADFDAKRAFLHEYVEQITFDYGKVIILGSLPLIGTVQGKLPLRIVGKIEKGSKRRWAQDERFGSWVPDVAGSSSIKNQCLMPIGMVAATPERLTELAEVTSPSKLAI